MKYRLTQTASKLHSRIFPFLLVVLMLLIVLKFVSLPAYAASLAVIGKAISVNTNGYLDFTNYNSNARVNWLTGEFEGYAFSEDLGWVAFGDEDHDNPNGAVTVNTSTGVVTGKARVLNTGADIVFSAPSNVVISPATGIITGFAWSEDIGWLDFSDPGVSIDNFTGDLTEPLVNASLITMSTSSTGGYSVSDGGYSNGLTPSFTWVSGTDNEGGSGLKGYCVYLGPEADADPGNSVTKTGKSGLLTNSPIETVGTDCMFIVPALDQPALDLSDDNYLSGSFQNGQTYYLRIKAIDNAGNTHNTAVTSFSFIFDNLEPTNVSYVSCPGGSFANVADMSFSWPVGAVSPPASQDGISGIRGWQYQINSTDDAGWRGTTTGIGLNYIPVLDTDGNPISSYSLTVDQDGESIADPGTYIIYFRAVDVAGNVSPAGTIRTCSIAYGGAAPGFEVGTSVTVTPSTSDTNSYSLSWPQATTLSEGRQVSAYYYMVNTPPPTSLSTLTGNPGTYIFAGTNTSVATGALPNVKKGDGNIVYVVAVDDANNYSPSNHISGTFELDSNNPDNVGNLVASDSSIKSQSQWNVTLTWTPPTYQGAGNLIYHIQRSPDGLSSFSEIGTTTGLSYVDNAPASREYFYKLITEDGAGLLSSGTNVVSITPTGKWTSPPELKSGPEVSSITTKRAKIEWSTSRASDSKIQYGTKTNDYTDVEPSNSDQVTSHEIELSGLEPETTYYYRAKWTDEDGNTGTSKEKKFITDSAPAVKDVSAKSIGLSSAVIEYTVKDASKVKIYYGSSTSFGGAKEVSTSTTETTYTTEISGLEDGTKYYYRINTFDSEDAEYEGTILDFTTLPRPRVTSVKVQQVANTAQPSVLVSWQSNTEVSSIVSYYPDGRPEDTRDEVNLALVTGEHKMVVRGLLPETSYVITVRGRDKIGNEAVSESQKLTTSTDTRSPKVSEMHVEGSNISPVGSAMQESMAQLIVSWNTDEPATSQVEFGEGTGTEYAQKTQEDANLTYNHIVIISGLTPSKVYHVRALSKDKAGNVGNSVDTVTITPKATENALDLVITNLQEAFGFLRGLK